MSEIEAVRRYVEWREEDALAGGDGSPERYEAYLESERYRTTIDAIREIVWNGFLAHEEQVAEIASLVGEA